MGDSQQWKPTAWEAGSLKSMCQGGLSLETFREGLSWPLPASDAPTMFPGFWLQGSESFTCHSWYRLTWLSLCACLCLCPKDTSCTGLHGTLGTSPAPLYICKDLPSKSWETLPVGISVILCGECSALHQRACGPPRMA